MESDDSKGDDDKEFKDYLLLSQYLERKSEFRAKIQYYITMSLALISIVGWIVLIIASTQNIIALSNEHLALGVGLLMTIGLSLLFSAATEEMNRWKFGDIIESEK